MQRNCKLTECLKIRIQWPSLRSSIRELNSSRSKRKALISSKCLPFSFMVSLIIRHQGHSHSWSHHRSSVLLVRRGTSTFLWWYDSRTRHNGIRRSLRLFKFLETNSQSFTENNLPWPWTSCDEPSRNDRTLSLASTAKEWPDSCCIKRDQRGSWSRRNHSCGLSSISLFVYILPLQSHWSH